MTQSIDDINLKKKYINTLTANDLHTNAGHKLCHKNEAPWRYLRQYCGLMRNAPATCVRYMLFFTSEEVVTKSRHIDTIY